MGNTTLSKRIKIQNQLAKAEQDRIKFRKINKTFKELGSIDKKHKSGKLTKKQHDQKSRKALEKLVKAVKK